MKRIHVVINPASGQPEAVLHTLNRVFGRAGAQWDISITHAAGDAARFAREAAQRGVDVVAAYGGDGTQMEVAQGLRGAGVPLGILPGGTANLLSVELDIPGNLEDAARLIVDPASRLRAVDMGHAVLRGGEEAHDFILRVGIGFEGLKIEKADRALKDKYGEFAYTVASVDALHHVQPAHYHLTLDGEQVEVDAVNLLVTNAGTFGMRGHSRSSKISVSDGLLDVLVIQGKSLTTLATVLVHTLQDKATSARPIWQAREIRIEADPPQPVNGDGELWGNTPIMIRVIPAAVHVLTPARIAPHPT